MQPEFVPKLAAVLDAYLTQADVIELSQLYGVTAHSLYTPTVGWLAVARELTEHLDRGNTRRFVDALLDVADDRNTDGVVHATYERQAFHQGFTSKLRLLRDMLRDGAASTEIVLPAGKLFSAPSQLRELLATAETPVLVVDPYVGPGTLDVLRDVGAPVYLLTGTASQSLASGFTTAVAQFRSEGRTIEVRQAAKLHDRHLVFNERCWLIGGSIKDAGKSMFNAIEIVDMATDAMRLLGERWQAATPLTSAT